MKNLITVLLSISFLLALNGCKEDNSTFYKPVKNVPLNSLEDSVAYFLGMNLTNQFSFFNQDDFRPDMVEKGVLDHIEKGDIVLTNDEKKDVMTDYFRWARAYHADSIMNRSNKFWRENAQNPNIIETPHGIQYEVIKEGSGEGSPDGNDIVKAHYKQGTALKGILVDPTNQRLENDTSMLVLNALYTGLSEAFQRMSPGAKWKVWVHPRVGSREGEDLLGVVEPNEVLYAEIEMYDFLRRSHADLGDEIIQKPGYFIDETKRFE